MLIYKHTNNITGLSYIGLTTRSAEKRLREHISMSNTPKTEFHKAIKEFGIENFTSEILEYCEHENLAEREKFWIEYYDTYNNGYNMKLGGNKCRKSEILDNPPKNKKNFLTKNDIREYIKFRLNMDIEITELKDLHNKHKMNLVYNIKQLNNISLQKIDYYISIYKNCVDESNIFEISTTVFCSLIESFDCNNSIYYNNNKDMILKYIIEIYTMKVELIKLNTILNDKLNLFIETSNISKFNLVKCVSIYNALDKLTEDDVDYDKYLITVTHEIEKEYFELRKSNDAQLLKLKTDNAAKKSEMICNIKQLNNVSLQKIDYHISIHKNEVIIENDIHKISNKVYDSILDSFEYYNQKYYENKKEQIINYISETYKMILEMKQLNKNLNSNISKFIKNNNINTYNAARLVKTYRQLKRA